MIVILRLGHRYVRDYRVTTHLALVARALGADKLLINKIEDEVKESINNVNEKWGKGLIIEEIGNNWKKAIQEWKNNNNQVVHLTMYGLNINNVIEQLKGKDLMIIVGAEKVPKEVYKLSDYNIAIGNQPHSEIAALAIFLDRYFNGKELENKFHGRVRIKPSNGYKIIEKL
jgi:tRNA (cytidine56-2'-O)-methyltransferase